MQNAAVVWADILAEVGPERYQLACEWAWRNGFENLSFGPDPWPEELAMVPHEAADLWGCQAAAIVTCAFSSTRFQALFGEYCCTVLDAPSTSGIVSWPSSVAVTVRWVVTDLTVTAT